MYIEKAPEHIFRIQQISDLCGDRDVKFIYIERDWLQVSLSIHKLCADSTRQSRWYGFQAAKLNAIKTYVSERKQSSSNTEDSSFYEAIESAISINQSTTAFYKGVLEWLLAKKAYEEAQARGVKILRVTYKELVSHVERVSKKIQDFTDGKGADTDCAKFKLNTHIAKS